MLEHYFSLTLCIHLQFQRLPKGILEVVQWTFGPPQYFQKLSLLIEQPHSAKLHLSFEIDVGDCW